MWQECGQSSRLIKQNTFVKGFCQKKLLTKLIVRGGCLVFELKRNVIDIVKMVRRNEYGKYLSTNGET